MPDTVPAAKTEKLDTVPAGDVAMRTNCYNTAVQSGMPEGGSESWESTAVEHLSQTWDLRETMLIGILKERSN